MAKSRPFALVSTISNLVEQDAEFASRIYPSKKGTISRHFECVYMIFENWASGISICQYFFKKKYWSWKHTKYLCDGRTHHCIKKLQSTFKSLKCRYCTQKLRWIDSWKIISLGTLCNFSKWSLRAFGAIIMQKK